MVNQSQRFDHGVTRSRESKAAANCLQAIALLTYEHMFDIVGQSYFEDQEPKETSENQKPHPRENQWSSSHVPAVPLQPIKMIRDVARSLRLDLGSPRRS